MSGGGLYEEGRAAEAERIRGVQREALARKVAPGTIGGAPPMLAPAVKVNEGIALVIQTTQVIPFRQILQGRNPMNGAPNVTDEQLGQYYDEVEKEMSRRGLKR
jgi:hypothetical protein